VRKFVRVAMAAEDDGCDRAAGSARAGEWPEDR